jgi:hypothetical protein
LGQTVCGFIGSAGDVNAAALCSMQLCASSRRRGQDGRDKRRRRGETTQCAKQLRRGHPRLLGRGLQAIRELQTQARRMRHVRRHLSTASAADGSIPQLCDAACNASHPVNLSHHASEQASPRSAQDKVERCTGWRCPLRMRRSRGHWASNAKRHSSLHCASRKWSLCFRACGPPTS